jgi:acetyltransferase-like isoleucine patch superfamily enzyme
MESFSRESHNQLIQVDNLLRLAIKRKPTRVICKKIIVGSNIGRKGGYSLSKVFGRNYLKLLLPAVSIGKISAETFSTEKKDILIKHILPYYFSMENDFKAFPLMDGLEDFENEDYFYPNLESCFVSYVKTSNDPQLQSDIATLWRLLNPHNETYFVKSNAYKNIRAGRMSYGPMHIHSWEDPEEGLEIGSFVSIGDNVNFLLGGEHPYDGLSTYPFKVKYFGQKREAKTRGKIVVSDDVWIGFGATIMSGAHIGQGAIIGAGAVITKDVEPYSIVVGNPARKIKNRFDQEIIDVLIKINYSTISDDLIFSIKDGLYEPMTLERAKLLLELSQSVN